jgi:hypothetical protein
MGHSRILEPAAIRGVLLSAAFSLLVPLCGLWAQQVDPGWPRDIVVPQGTITVYQPQAEGLNGDVFFGRAAISFLKDGEQRLVLGVLWFQARLNVDRDQRNAELADVRVTRIRFPNATPEQEQRVGRVVQEAIQHWPAHPISMDRLEAILEVAKKDHASAEGLKNDPPQILFAEEPSVLVLYDGAPALRDLPGTKLQRVVNTPFPVLYDPASATYYLTNTMLWFSAKDALGPWQPVAAAPAEVAATLPPEARAQAKDDQNPLLTLTPPKIFAATVPTELIWTDGKPSFRPLGSNGDLLYAENTDANLFMDSKAKAYYVLLSGRWFTAASLQGPWAFVQPRDLPPSFGTILPSSSKGPVRASIPGTEESKNALMDTQIPQTFAVRRGVADDVKTTFDGEPQFRAVEGVAGLEWAVNSPQQILRQGGTCFLCKGGIWYVAAGPGGPWSVSDKRPDGVDKIPASNPHFNTRYVQVFDATPEVVYVGYTPGYLGAFVYYGAVVYGTGWTYPGWVGASYYPRTWTWGWGANWTPRKGWGMGSGFGWGFAWGFAWASALDQWGWGGGCWGPGGIYRALKINSLALGSTLTADWPGAKPSQVAQAGKIPANNLYSRGDNPARRATTEVILQSKQDLASRPKAAKKKSNNIFAGDDGQVYRRTSDGLWQKSGPNGWIDLGSLKAGTPGPGGAKSAADAQPPDLLGMRSFQQQALDYEYVARQVYGLEPIYDSTKDPNFSGHSAGGGGVHAYDGPPKKP